MKSNWKSLVIIPAALITLLAAGCSPKAVEQTASLPASATVSEVTAQATEPPSIEIPSIDIPWDERSIFSSGLIASERGVLNELPGASVYHIGFQIADDFLTLTGWEEVLYTNREEIPLEEVYFQLFPNTSGGKTIITSLSVDGVDVAPIYEFDDSALLVSLPAPLPVGDSIAIRMDFEVEVARVMEGNYGLFGYFDGILVLDEFYPVIPVYDNEGWNVQAPPPNADTSYFDMSFYLVSVSAPADLVMAASGVEIARTQDGKRQTVTYAAGPSRDFYLAGSQDFIVKSDKVGETTINSYALRGYEACAEYALQYAGNALVSFGDSFGSYPYTEFDLLSTPMLALGIEYPGIVGIVTTAYDPNETVSDVPFPAMLESLIAHEAAHQWFYSIVGSDQIDEPWLDEGMAQYCTWLYYADVYGEANAGGYRQSWDQRWERVERAEIPIGLPAAAYQGREYSAIIYGRSAIFIETLAETMGEPAFAAFLKDYYETHQWGIATGGSFKETAEAACNCDLTALFEEWVYPQIPIKNPD